MLELMQALKYIHDSDLLHRDIKTENIFLDKNLNIKLGDFGTAKLKQQGRVHSSEGKIMSLINYKKLIKVIMKKISWERLCFPPLRY